MLKQAHHYARHQDLIMDQLFLIKYPRNNPFELNFDVRALFLHSNVWCIAWVSIIGIPIVNPESTWCAGPVCSTESCVWLDCFS